MRRAVLLLCVLAGCGGDDDAAPADAGPPDGPPPPDAAEIDASFSPMSLAETGLFADFASETLAAGVFEYTVNYELWADGATKRRWIYLPEGRTIDTSDMDFWRFPVGTKLWKEFTRDGVRIETRLLWKQGPSDQDDWYSMSYAWDEARSEALAVAEGAQDAIGTEQDIPRSTDCKICHQRQPGFLLGFSALQLDHDTGDMNLPALIAEDRLSAPPSGTSAPIFPLPEDQSGAARPALGYLHGNCGPCHNENSEFYQNGRTRIVWHLEVDSLATVEDTTIYRTTVRIPPYIPAVPVHGAVIQPGNRTDSAAFYRMTVARDPLENSLMPMPPLATDLVDVNGGVAALGAWIDSMPPPSALPAASPDGPPPK